MTKLVRIILTFSNLFSAEVSQYLYVLLEKVVQ